MPGFSVASAPSLGEPKRGGPLYQAQRDVVSRITGFCGTWISIPPLEGRAAVKSVRLTEALDFISAARSRGPKTLDPIGVALSGLYAERNP